MQVVFGRATIPSARGDVFFDSHGNRLSLPLTQSSNIVRGANHGFILDIDERWQQERQQRELASNLFALGANVSGRLGVGWTSLFISQPNPCVFALPSAPLVVTMVATSQNHSLALAGGRVFVCGSFQNGLLGLGREPARTATRTASPAATATVTARETHGPPPSQVAGAGGADTDCCVRCFTPIPALLDVRVRHISCGPTHSLAIDDFGAHGGRAWTWGLGQYGALGHGAVQVEWTPRVVQPLEGTYTYPDHCLDLIPCTLSVAEVGAQNVCIHFSAFFVERLF